MRVFSNSFEGEGIPEKLIEIKATRFHMIRTVVGEDPEIVEDFDFEVTNYEFVRAYLDGCIREARARRVTLKGETECTAKKELPNSKKTKPG
jgi:hypothetical protein